MVGSILSRPCRMLVMVRFQYNINGLVQLMKDRDGAVLCQTSPQMFKSFLSQLTLADSFDLSIVPFDFAAASTHEEPLLKLQAPEFSSNIDLKSDPKAAKRRRRWTNNRFLSVCSH